MTPEIVLTAPGRILEILLHLASISLAPPARPDPCHGQDMDKDCPSQTPSTHAVSSWDSLLPWCMALLQAFLFHFTLARYRSLAFGIVLNNLPEA
ncbi:hypothetical protein PT974_03432 [Cladobotryum mycophilum]|uniref:Uncharacterized protein n=1 Tax=Cladobotryum mycophilum TaxID=491253 RepID=A0ABR0SSE6_9HYPO